MVDQYIGPQLIELLIQNTKLQCLVTTRVQVHQNSTHNLLIQTNKYLVFVVLTAWMNNTS
jgi:hypothetical protein